MLPMIKDREHALEVANRYLETKDDAEIAPHVRDLMTHKAEQTFAIMQGSGNEMGLYGQFIGLLGMHGFISRQESIDLIRAPFSSSLPLRGI